MIDERHVAQLGHALASRGNGHVTGADDALEVQLASDLDFRAQNTAYRGETITTCWLAEAETCTSLSTVLEWTARVTAQTTVLVTIQTSRVAGDHAWQAETCLAGRANVATTAEESAIEVG